MPKHPKEIRNKILKLISFPLNLVCTVEIHGSSRGLLKGHYFAGSPTVTPMRCSVDQDICLLNGTDSCTSLPYGIPCTLRANGVKGIGRSSVGRQNDVGSCPITWDRAQMAHR